MRVTQVVRVTQTVTPNLLHASMVATPHGKPHSGLGDVTERRTLCVGPYVKPHSVRWNSRKTALWLRVLTERRTLHPGGSRKNAFCDRASRKDALCVTARIQNAPFGEMRDRVENCGVWEEGEEDHRLSQDVGPTKKRLKGRDDGQPQ